MIIACQQCRHHCDVLHREHSVPLQSLFAPLQCKINIWLAVAWCNLMFPCCNQPSLSSLLAIQCTRVCSLLSSLRQSTAYEIFDCCVSSSYRNSSHLAMFVSFVLLFAPLQYDIKKYSCHCLFIAIRHEKYYPRHCFLQSTVAYCNG